MTNEEFIYGSDVTDGMYEEPEYEDIETCTGCCGQEPSDTDLLIADLSQQLADLSQQLADLSQQLKDAKDDRDMWKLLTSKYADRAFDRFKQISLLEYKLTKLTPWYTKLRCWLKRQWGYETRYQNF